MLTWLTANLGTIIITLILIGIVTAIIISMKKDKKKGMTSCGCGCQNCAMHGMCHK